MNDRAGEVLKLKPCPFCGSEVELSASDFACYVTCTKCGTQQRHFWQGGCHYSDYDREQDAIYAWNLRIPDTTALAQAKREGIEAMLRAALDAYYDVDNGKDPDIVMRENADKLIAGLKEKK